MILPKKATKTNLERKIQNFKPCILYMHTLSDRENKFGKLIKKKSTPRVCSSAAVGIRNSTPDSMNLVQCTRWLRMFSAADEMSLLFQIFDTALFPQQSWVFFLRQKKLEMI